MQASTSKSGKHLKNVRIEVAIVKEQGAGTKHRYGRYIILSSNVLLHEI